jgi:hypothetical protein
MSNNKKRSNINNDDSSATAAGEESASTSSLVVAGAAAASAAPALTSPVRAVGLSSLLSRASTTPQSISPEGKKKVKIETKKLKIYILKHQDTPFALAIPDAYRFKEKLKALANAGVTPVVIGETKFERHLSLKIFYQAGIFLPEFKTLLNSSWYLTETMEGLEDATVAFRDNFVPLAGKLAYGLNSTIPSPETGY